MAAEDKAPCWRDLADQLTPEHFTWLARLEAKFIAGGGRVEEIAADMLDFARDIAAKDLVSRTAFGWLPSN